MYAIKLPQLFFSFSHIKENQFTLSLGDLPSEDVELEKQ
jgi:hypothetical protein